MLGVLTLSAIGIQVASITAPLYLRNFIDAIAHTTPSPEAMRPLLIILCIFAAISFASFIANRIQQFVISHLEARAMADLSSEAFEYLIGHSHSFFISNFVGTLTRRVNRYSSALEQVIDIIFFNFFPTVLFALGVITILFLKSHILGLALLALTFLVVVAQLILTRLVQPLRIARAAEDSRVTGFLSDAIGNHAAVTLFAAEADEKKDFAHTIGRWRKALLRSWIADTWVWFFQDFVTLAIEIGIFVSALFLWQKGYVTVGDFVLIQIYIVALIDRLGGIGNNIRRIYTAFSDAYEMIEILETPHEIVDVPGAKPLAVANGTISFKDVGFAFNQTRSVLTAFTLEIPGGQKVALVGPSGAGKSTVTKLLLRLHDVTSGEILIDGQNIAHMTQKSLRAAVSYVPQEPVLFHRTLAENIRYGKRDASMEEVERAARLAHCHEFISLLPDNYNTYVGERGVKLSGGERQRIAIARAILKNAPILFLDEATSSLDSESESLIQDALKTLMKGKTAVVIAHRLSTIMSMDRIVVLENGKIVAEGTHGELLTQGGLYEKLWSLQAGGFLEE